MSSKFHAISLSRRIPGVPGLFPPSGSQTNEQGRVIVTALMVKTGKATDWLDGLILGSGGGMACMRTCPASNQQPSETTSVAHPQLVETGDMTGRSLLRLGAALESD